MSLEFFADAIYIEPQVVQQIMIKYIASVENKCRFFHQLINFASSALCEKLNSNDHL